MNYLDIIDSAVKIGLGALTAGVFTTIQSGKQYSRDLQKGKIVREFDLLRKVADQIETFTHILLKFWASSQDAHRDLRDGGAISDRKLEGLGEARNELYHAFKEVTSSESILMLLGQKAASSSIRDYGNVADRFCKRAVNRSDPWTEAEGKQWAKDIRQARDKVYDHLAESYQRLDT